MENSTNEFRGSILKTLATSFVILFISGILIGCGISDSVQGVGKTEEEVVEQEAKIDIRQSKVVVSPIRGISPNGTSVATISIEIRDEKGQPVKGLKPLVTVSGTGNSLGNFEATDRNGQTRMTLASTIEEVKDITVSLEKNAQNFVLGQHPQVQFGSLFLPQVEYACGGKTAEVFDVSSGDITGDGVVDLFGTSAYEAGLGSFWTLPGDGSGSFQKPIRSGSTEVGFSPVMASGSLTPNGSKALFFYYNRQVGFASSSGDGTFTWRWWADYVDLQSNIIQNIDVGFVNGDLNLDFAVLGSNPSTAGYKLWTFLGNGNNTYVEGNSVIPETSFPVYRSALGDLNEDGHVDVVLSELSGTRARIYWGYATGSFEEKFVELKAHEPICDVQMVDLDKNGFKDLVTANCNVWSGKGRTVSVFYQPRSQVFLERRDFVTGDYPNRVAFGDFNGDDYLDLVTSNAKIGSNGTGNSVTVLLGDEFGNFGDRRDHFVGSKPQAIHVTDLNQDGKLEIITANQGANTISVLK